MSQEETLTQPAHDAPDDAPSRRQTSRWSPNIRQSGPVLFLVLLVILFGATTERFLLPSNIRSVFFTAAILVVATMAQAGVVITRNLDLSVGSIMAAASYIPLLLYSTRQGSGWWVVPAVLAIGAVLGACNGLIVSYVRIPSIIATLGTLSIFRGLVYAAGGGEEVNVGEVPRWLPMFVSWRPFGVPAIVVVALLVAAGMGLVLRRTQFGRTLYAVGSNPDAASFYGLPAQRTVLKIYVVAGALAGLAGLLLAGRVGTLTVDIANGWELQTLAAAVIGGASLLGGAGTAFGAAIGALIIATIDNGLVQMGISGYWQIFVQGCAIVAAVGFDVLLRRQTARRLGRVGQEAA